MTNSVTKIWISIGKYLNFGTLLRIIYHINKVMCLDCNSINKIVSWKS